MKIKKGFLNLVAALLLAGTVTAGAAGVTLPTLQAAGALAGTDLAWCRVAASATPTSDSKCLLSAMKTFFLNGNAATATTAGTLTGALSANQILGSLTAVAPTGQTVPSCSTSASALLWTSGTGFSCNTALAAPASAITGSTLASGVTVSSLTTLGSSGSLSGNWTATTQSAANNSTRLATTAYADTSSSNAGTAAQTAATTAANTYTDSLFAAFFAIVHNFTAQQNFGSVTTNSSSNSTAWNLNTAQNAKQTMTENTTLANPTNMVDGGVYQFAFTQHASAAKTLAFGNAYIFAGDSTVNATVSSITLYTCVSDGTKMRCVMSTWGS